MNRASAVAVACTGAFVAALSTSFVAVTAPVVARDLGVSQADVGWILSAYLLTVSSVLALSGRLADLFGRARMFLVGFLVFGLSALGCGLAPTLPWLVAARVAQAAGASVLMAAGPAIITRAFPASQRARGLGLQLGATYFGLALGPTAAGAIATAAGWHAVFLTIAAAALAGAVVSWRALGWSAPEEEKRPALDLGGAALFAVGLGALLIALRRVSAASLAASVALLVTSAAAFALFVRREARHPSPLLPLALLRTPAFAYGVALSVALYTVTLNLSWLLPFELQHARGMSPAHAGAILTAQPVMMALVAPASGWIADRFGARAPTVVGMLALGSGTGLVALETSPSDPALVATLALVGVGAGLFVAPNNAVIMGAAPRERQGTAAAMMATARNVGMTCGVALAVALHPALGFRGAVAAGAAIAIAGAVVGLARPVLTRRVLSSAR